MNPDCQLRLFVALELPQALREELERLGVRLRKSIAGPLQWVRTEGVHLTLKFLGNVSAGRLAEISQPLAQAAAGSGPLHLCARGLGAFPNLERPRVIWLAVEGDLKPLALLHQEIETSLVPLGFPPEDRPFRPHLTLARVKKTGILKGLTPTLNDYRSYEAGRFTANNLSLIKSDLKPQGAVYTTLASFTLGV
jgi:2'-5' RNA ligase